MIIEKEGRGGKSRVGEEEKYIDSLMSKWSDESDEAVNLKSVACTIFVTMHSVVLIILNLLLMHLPTWTVANRKLSYQYLFKTYISYF